MTGNGKGKNNGGNSITSLRLLFVCLSVGCLMQIAYETIGILFLPVCEPVYYVSDGSSSNMRPLDPDLPMDSLTDARENVESHMDDPIPKFVIEPLFRLEQNRIDRGMDDASRCENYGVDSLPGDKKYQRRIFFGSMLANENTDVILAHAIEVYNKYSVVALVESNTTFSGAPRPMNYGPKSTSARTLQESEIFGTAEHTKVVIDYWLDDRPELILMSREVEQRNKIWKIWVDQGMTERDVGIMADLDEIVSRDFLNALQVCDFPKLRYNPDKRNSCQMPKMILSTIQFESSPLCVKKKTWFHPDLLPGSCILGVGDSTGRVTPERDYHKTLGSRTLDWGKYDNKRYPQDVIDNSRFPLWDGRDMREVSGSDEPLTNFVNAERRGHRDTAHFGTAYHLHNWYTDTEVLRHKYATYGHASKEAINVPLSKVQGDVDLMVRCARGLGNQVHEGIGKMPHDLAPYYENNAVLPEGREGGVIFAVGGNRPIYFQNRAYVEERHALVQKMVRADEEIYGTIHKRQGR